jgi:tryptophan-rich sensory protein
MVNKLLSLAVSVGIPMVGGFVGGLATAAEVKGWYTRIKKPKWTPPNWLFGPAWSVFYIAQGVAAWLVWLKKDVKNVQTPLILYGIQLALNFCWTPIFFTLHRPDLATAEATAIIGVATAATVSMSKVAGANKVLPLMLPYLGWMTFATALAANIAINNPEAHKIDASQAEDPAAEAGNQKKAPAAKLA